MVDMVEQITGVIGDAKSWAVAEQSGELVLVDVPGRPGAKMKMHKAEAIRRGLWKDEERKANPRKNAGAGGEEGEKARGQVRNKMRRATANKVT